jgi:UDP-2,3-diacylglucosamine pyrophosphatase LpxH
MKVTRPRYKVVAGGDAHIPFHHRAVIQEFLRLIKAEKPTHVVLTGDMVDMYNLSRYLKDPLCHTTEFELVELQKLFTSLRKASPKGKIYYLEGNHEERPIKYLFRNAPAVLAMNVLNIPKFLKLKKYGIKWVSHREELRIDGILYTHGHKTVTVAGGSVRAMQMSFREDMVMGHCHRLAHIYTEAGNPDRSQIVGVEAGFLGDKKGTGFSYVSRANWCNGAVVIDKRKPRLEIFE